MVDQSGKEVTVGDRIVHFYIGGGISVMSRKGTIERVDMVSGKITVEWDDHYTGRSEIKKNFVRIDRE